MTAGAATSPAPASPLSVEQLRLWQRFHIRLSLVYAALVLAVLAAMASAYYRLATRTEVRALQGRLLAVATSLAGGIDPAEVLTLDDPGDVDSPAYRALVDRFAAVGTEQAEVTSIYVLRTSERPGWLDFAADWVREGSQGVPGEPYDATQAPVMLSALVSARVEDEPYSDRWGYTLSGYAPLRDATGAAIGVVGVDVDATSVELIRRTVRDVTLALSGVTALLLGAMTWAVGHSVRRPLGRIIEAAAAIEQGRFDVQVPAGRSDEFGILGRHFAHMARGLRERELIRSVFGRYVSQEVAREVLAGAGHGGLGGEERAVTALVTDLRGYSTISEHLQPTQVVELLNSYLGAMSEVVEAHGGCVVEFLGDSILAVFGAPARVTNHAERAVRCALAMRQRLAELNRDWAESGLARLWTARGHPDLAARVGVHTGIVVAGNLGGSNHVKYSVVGDAVVVATTLEGQNKSFGTDLLLSWDTWSRLPAELRGRARAVGELRVPGRGQAVTALTL